MPLDTSTLGKSAKASRLDGADVSAPRPQKVEVDDLEGECVYFTLADVFNSCLYAKLISENVDSKAFLIEFDQMLQASLVLYDHVIVQCADCLRSEHLRHVLRKHPSLSTDGSILFVFTDSTEIPANDFRSYVEARKERYRHADYNQEDLRSLEYTDEAMEETNNVFRNINQFVVKGESGTDKFKELVNGDLVESSFEIVFGGPTTKTIPFGLHQFTLHQLVTSKYCRGGKLESVFDPASSGSLVDAWRVDSSSDAKRPFSRHTILNALRECSGIAASSESLKRLRGSVIDEVELRLGLLYGKVNAGKHMVLDFDPARNKSGIHSIECFARFWHKALQGRELTYSNVAELRKNEDELYRFRREYYYSVCRLLSRPGARTMNGSKLNMKTYGSVLKTINPLVSSDKREVEE